MRNPAIVAAISALLCAAGTYSQHTGTHQPKPFGARLNRQPLKSLAPPGTKTVVLFFVASDCPISNRTFPEMQRLRDAFTPQGVRFWFVYPNFTEHPADIARHQREYDAAGDAITDPDASLTHLTHAFVTPEAAILVPDGAGWKPVYTGRIDDRFVRIGLERPAPTKFLVADVLTALLTGQPVPSDPVAPVGCTILRAQSAEK